MKAIISAVAIFQMLTLQSCVGIYMSLVSAYVDPAIDYLRQGDDHRCIARRGTGLEGLTTVMVIYRKRLPYMIAAAKDYFGKSANLRINEIKI